MTLIILGQSRCPLCGEVFGDSNEIFSTTFLVGNEADELFPFNRTAMHRSCLEKHPLGERIIELDNEIMSKVSPGNRFCVVCGNEIMHPDEYWYVGQLSPDPNQPIYPFNHSQFHKSCLARWYKLSEFRSELEKLRDSGTWKGSGLDYLLNELNNFVASPR
jgi:ribosomal protein S27AE